MTDNLLIETASENMITDTDKPTAVPDKFWDANKK